MDKTFKNLICFMNTIRNLMIVSVFVFTLSACDEGENIIYITGQCMTTVGSDEKYVSYNWINNKRMEIPDLSPNHGDKRGIFVSNGDVYLAGCRIIDGDRNKTQPCYWKNEQKFDLDPGEHEAGNANCIYIADDKVYTAGYVIAYKEHNTFVVPYPQLCYWTNTSRTDITDLPAETEEVKITGIFVDGSNVFVCGYYRTFKDGKYSDYQGCWWKNGVRTDVSQKKSMVNAIFIENGKVYLAGMYDIHAFDGTACYWVDGEVVILDSEGRIEAIYVDNGTVYSAGETSQGGCYWKGNTKIIVESHNFNTRIRIKSLFVKNGIVYTAGWIINYAEISAGGAYWTYPCYWIEKKRINLPMPPGREEKMPYNEAYGIFVK
jgi:hypothetical protein